jgi:dipeptidyl aminopeptidase/acylaminoacyl peptidase
LAVNSEEKSLEEILVATEKPDDPRLSPDGAWITWAVSPYSFPVDKPAGSIWLAPVDGSRPATKFTRGNAHDFQPRWSPDGTVIAFLSDRAERGTYNLYEMSLSGGEARQLTFRKSGVSSFSWSPDGRSIAFLAADDPTEEDERRKKELDDANVYGERWQFGRIHVFDTETREVRTLPTGERHVFELAWSPDSQHMAFFSSETPETESQSFAHISTIALDGNDTVELGPAGGLFVMQLTWSPDDTRLYYVRSHEPVPSSFAIYSKDLDCNPPTLVTPAVTDQECSLGVRVIQGDQRLLITIARGLDTRLEWLDPDSGERELLFTPPEGQEFSGLFSIALGANGKPVLAVIGSNIDEPPELFAGRPESLRKITDHHEALADYAFGTPEAFFWTASDGLEMDGVLVRPRESPGGPLPLIVFPHGGPYGRDNLEWEVFPNWFAHHGFAVFLPNYRGGMGRGNEFASWGHGGTGDMEFDDVMTGVDALIERGIADPERLGIGGWSQGGFLTAWAVTQTHRFKAGMMGAGVSDWNMMVMTSDVPTIESMLGGNRPWDGPGPHRSQNHSPISFAKNVQTPLLIIHGEQDPRVPVSQAIGFHRALLETGSKSMLVTYPREPHGFRERNHQIDLLRRLRDWFTEHV